jgi:bud site selection protein 20
MGPKVGRKRQHHSIRDNSRRTRTRARTRDLDQVFEDMKKPLVIKQDADLPGFGKNYCNECARHFITMETYETHCKTKLHKKRVKTLKNDTAYTQKDAELAAGLLTDNGPGRN